MVYTEYTARGLAHVPGYTDRQQVPDLENRFFAFFDDD
jgi:hypothetical protein